MVKKQYLIFLILTLIFSVFVFSDYYSSYPFTTGDFNFTFYDSPINAVKLNNTYLNGTYTSEIFDFTSADSIDNISISKDANWTETLIDNENMRAMWHFNNNTIDVVNGNNLTNPAGPSYDPTYSSNGRFNGSYDYDNDDVFYINSNSNIEIGAKDYSLSAWVYPDAVDGVRAIIFKQKDSSDRDYRLFINNGEVFYDYEANNGGEQRAQGGIVQTNKWSHIVATYENSTKEMNIYLNNVLVDTNIASYVPIATDAVLYIGALSMAGGSGFNGLIDETIIWNKTLTQDDIDRIYKQGITKLNISYKLCGLNDCSDNTTWTEIIGYDESYAELGSTADYMQYKAYFQTEHANNSNELYNVSIGYTSGIINGNITLISPEDEGVYTNTTVFFNCSYSDPNTLYSHINISIWNSTGNLVYSETKDPAIYGNGDNNGSIEFNATLLEDVYTWSCSGGNLADLPNWAYATENYTVEIGDLPVGNPQIEYYNSSKTLLDYNLNGTHGGTMQIKINVAIDPNNAGVVNHSLYLTNVNGTIIYTISDSFYSPDDSDIILDFDTTSFDDGLYRMNLTVVSDEDLTFQNSFLAPVNFTINNTEVTPTGGGLTEEQAEWIEAIYKEVRNMGFLIGGLIFIGILMAISIFFVWWLKEFYKVPAIIITATLFTAAMFLLKMFSVENELGSTLQSVFGTFYVISLYVMYVAWGIGFIMLLVWLFTKGQPKNIYKENYSPMKQAKKMREIRQGKRKF